MRESDLLAYIYKRSADLAAVYPGVLVGPGHDCAAVRLGGDVVLLKVDQVVEGRHFASDTPLDLVARKSIARAVSDIAAAGGTPACALASGTLPRTWLGRADALFDAMASWARHWASPLVGGDISTLAEGQAGPLVLSVTVAASPHPVRGPLTRSGARPGDNLYVTGSLGGSLTSGRHLSFEPRLAEARWLCDTLGPCLHAMMDLSDGLGIDAGRLARASGVRLVLEGAALPISPDAAGDWRRAVSDGEDYELLFAAEGEPPAPAAPNGTPLTRIGRVESGGGAVLMLPGGNVEIAGMGWEHA